MIKSCMSPELPEEKVLIKKEMTDKVICDEGQTSEIKNVCEIPEEFDRIRQKVKQEPELDLYTQCSTYTNSLDHTHHHKKTVYNGQLMYPWKHGEPEEKTTLMDTVINQKCSSSSKEMVKDTVSEMTESKISVSSMVSQNRPADISDTHDSGVTMVMSYNCTDESSNVVLVSEKKVWNDTAQGSQCSPLTEQCYCSHSSSSSVIREKCAKSDVCGLICKRTLPGTKTHNCDVRDSGLTQSGYIIADEMINAGMTHTQCEVCGTEFSVHESIHTGEKPTTCSSCTECTNFSNLRSHTETHTGEKPFTSNDFCEGFVDGGNLLQQKITQPVEKPFTCVDCGEGFACRSSLKRHKRTHTGEKPFICDVCGARLADSSNLKYHKRIHTGEKPFICGDCGVGFSLSCTLKQHRRTHTGEKPYKCDICNTGFSQLSNLKSHKKIHTGEKPYKCDVCDAGFITLNDLKRHIRIHTGEKPYKCNTCGAAFCNGSHLKRHEKIHMVERPYKCDTCGAGFRDTGHLKRHQITHTGAV